MISDKDVILGAPAFAVEQIISGIGPVIGLLTLGIALLRAKGPAQLALLGRRGRRGVRTS